MSTNHYDVAMTIHFRMGTRNYELPG